MAFGQVSGPPATHKQLQRLSELLEQAGHADFRDARGPMGFDQRQANGKFTRDDADRFIEQLEAELEGGPPPTESPKVDKIVATPATRRSAPAAANPSAAKTTTTKAKPATKMTMSQVLRKASDQDLAAELQRRGWVVMEP